MTSEAKQRFTRQERATEIIMVRWLCQMPTKASLHKHKGFEPEVGALGSNSHLTT